MDLGLETIVLVKPEAFERMDKKAAKGVFQAEQRALSWIKNGIDIGEKQLQAKTGYTNENLPKESPTATEFTLDDIAFELKTNVKVVNPPYQTAFDMIAAFLEVLVQDREDDIRRDNVRTFDGKAYVEWNYLMKRVLGYISRITQLGVENKFEKIKAPEELDASLDKLVVPVNLIEKFDIEKPGAARFWYQARKFYDEVIAATVAPFKGELVARSRVTEMPAETKRYWEQIEEYLFVVDSIPSAQRQPGKVLKRLFTVPRKTKPTGSTALPIIVGPENYGDLLEEFRPGLAKSLGRWKDVDGKIGEVVVFYYGLENDAKVQEQMPFLPNYDVKRDGDKIFVSVQALYDRMKALQTDYKTNRLLRKHSAVPIV